ncbi:MAG: hypothetical protein V4582_13160 [Pseudomonadota bacterium]
MSKALALLACELLHPGVPSIHYDAPSPLTNGNLDNKRLKTLYNDSVLKLDALSTGVTKGVFKPYFRHVSAYFAGCHVVFEVQARMAQHVVRLHFSVFHHFAAIMHLRSACRAGAVKPKQTLQGFPQ